MDHTSSPDQPVSIHPDILALKDKAHAEGLETIWERAAAQEPQCGFPPRVAFFHPKNSRPLARTPEP